jgi:ArsR family transcriptional regulator
MSAIYELQAELCRAFSHPVRLELVHHLRDGPKRVSELAQLTQNNPGTVSRHLAILRNSGILTAQHHGRDIIYQIIDTRISDLCDLMRQVLIEQAVKHSQVLKNFDDVSE